MVQRTKLLKQLVTYLNRHGYRFNVRYNEMLIIEGCNFTLFFKNEYDVIIADRLKNKITFRVYRFHNLLEVLQNHNYKIIKDNVNYNDLSRFVQNEKEIKVVKMNMSTSFPYSVCYNYSF